MPSTPSASEAQAWLWRRGHLCLLLAFLWFAVTLAPYGWRTRYRERAWEVNLLDFGQGKGQGYRIALWQVEYWSPELFSWFDENSWVLHLVPNYGQVFTAVDSLFGGLKLSGKDGFYSMNEVAKWNGFGPLGTGSQLMFVAGLFTSACLIVSAILAYLIASAILSKNELVDMMPGFAAIASSLGLTTYAFKTSNVPIDSFLDSAFYFSVMLCIVQYSVAIIANRDTLRPYWNSFCSALRQCCSNCGSAFWEWKRGKNVTSKPRRRTLSAAPGSVGSYGTSQV